jgi:hypothetical protein
LDLESKALKALANFQPRATPWVQTQKRKPRTLKGVS